jgi:hypothetical protein
MRAGEDAMLRCGWDERTRQPVFIRWKDLVQQVRAGSQAS